MEITSDLKKSRVVSNILWVYFLVILVICQQPNWILWTKKWCLPQCDRREEEEGTYLHLPSSIEWWWWSSSLSLHFKGRSSVIGGPYRNLHESPKAEGSVNSYGATSLGFWKREEGNPQSPFQPVDREAWECLKAGHWREGGLGFRARLAAHCPWRLSLWSCWGVGSCYWLGNRSCRRLLRRFHLYDSQTCNYERKIRVNFSLDFSEEIWREFMQNTTGVKSTHHNWCDYFTKGVK